MSIVLVCPETNRTACRRCWRTLFRKPKIGENEKKTEERGGGGGKGKKRKEKEDERHFFKSKHHNRHGK